MNVNNNDCTTIATVNSGLCETLLLPNGNARPLHYQTHQ